MPAAAPERTHETEEPTRESPEEGYAPPARGARRPQAAARSFAQEEDDTDDAREDGEPGEQRRRDRQAGLGNGYLAATREPGPQPPTAPVERAAAIDRARRTRAAAEAGDEPEYAQSVRLERPQRSEPPPIEDSPEGERTAVALEEESAGDQAEAETAGEEGEEQLEEAEAETEHHDESAESESVLGELEQEKEQAAGEEGDAEEKGAGAAGGETAPALPAGVMASQAAAARLSVAAGGLAEAAQRPTSFAPHPEERSASPVVAARGAEKRRASESLANAFMARNAHHSAALLDLASTAPTRIFAAADAAKASVDAAVGQNIAAVTGAIAAALADAQGQAAGARAAVQGQRAVTLATITVATVMARVEVELLFAQTSATLTSMETTQKSGIAAAYQSWHPALKAVGTEIGGEALALARTKGDAWLAMRNGESTLLDGPIHDNKLEAKADAAKSVAEAYRAEFEKAAGEQADQVIAGEAEVQRYVGESAAQARDGLTKHRDAIVEALHASQDSSLEQTNTLADQMLQSIDSSLAATSASLMEQQVVQVARLNEYALSQKTAIDDQAGQAVAALLDGGAQAVDGFSQSMREFLDAAVGMDAPDGEELSPALAEVQAQVDALAATMLGQMEQGIAASEQGVAAGGAQAVDSVNQLGQSAVEQAQAAASGYAESVAAMLQQATDGFARLRDGHQETADAVRTSAREGFTEAETGLRDAFAELSTNTADNLSAARDQMREGMRQSLPQLEKDIETEAQKAADAVQPRWKSVLKWVITIVVIVAVIALTIVSAGALGVVGTILLGAALGAAAGAATTIGHNLVDGKKWSDGVVQAMVVGAIGGAFGGIGGAIAGKVASVGLKFAIETGVDVIGGIVGDLAVGNPLTVQGVLFGAAIGAGVGAGVGIAGALKGKIKIRPTPPVSAPAPRVGAAAGAPPAPKSGTRKFLERTTILAKTPDLPAAPRPPKPAPEPPKPPKAAGEAPAAKPSPAAKAAPEPPAPKPRPAPEPPPPPKARPEPEAPAPKATPDADVPPTAPKPAEPSAPKPAAEPSAPKAKPDAEVPAAAPKAAPDADAPVKVQDAPPGKTVTPDDPNLVAVRKTKDGKHTNKVNKDGGMERCTFCELEPYKNLLADHPNLVQRLDDVKAKLGSKNRKTRRAAQQEFDDLSEELESLLRARKAKAAEDAAKADAPEGVAAPAKKPDADKLLTKDRSKFKRRKLEDAYQEYVKRKIARKQTPRDRLDWKEASDWWRKKSPTARGNKFNAKAKKTDRYPYHEVTLSNGKRLDSYDPVAGEIISRKATNLELVSKDTFDEYIDEIFKKYKPPKKIATSPSGPMRELRGETIPRGTKMVLEVPDTRFNRHAAEYRGFAAYAQSKGVEIRFMKE